jgi:potassium efflux system protein
MSYWQNHSGLKRHRQGVPGRCFLSAGIGCLMLALSLSSVARQKNSTSPETPEPAPIEVPATSETPAPVAIAELSESRSGIQAEIRTLQEALTQRQRALENTRERLAFAETWRERLKSEYQGLQRRLATAGLDLTREYANLLRRRLDRLERQHLAGNLTETIKGQLEAARMEQFRLEEFDALLQPSEVTSNPLAQRRAELLTKLSSAVTAHLEALNNYFASVNATQELIINYQSLLRQRLFWLPSTDPVHLQSFPELVSALAWLFDPGHGRDLAEGAQAAVRSHPVLSVFLALLLAGLAASRAWTRRALEAAGQNIGNVARDRIRHTFAGLGYSIILALTGTVALILLALLVSPAGDLGAELSRGFINAAFLFFLLSMVFQIARPGGLGERHFKWRAATLDAIRRGMPRLLIVMVPAAILTPLTEAATDESFRDSLGRVVFAVASIALALFSHRVLKPGLAPDASGKVPLTTRLIYLAVVATPLILMGFSLYGYHYTAVQLEGTLFITACWVGVVALFYYLALRALAVRERRLTLDRLREQRAAEREKAAVREAADASGEGLPATLDMPEMDLQDISNQSKALLRILAAALTVVGLWMFWANVFPAFRFLDEVTLWTVTPLAEGGQALAVTLEDLLLSLLLVTATVMAARNLPGTLEVAVLSRMELAPGTGYAITTLATYVIVIIGVVMTFGALGAQWSKLQWLVAALGVGLGFGLQEIVANFVSGIIILFERPIRVGDTVTIAGKTGTVARIRIRATTLIDWDRKEQIVPNKAFVTQDLTNWTLSDSITRVIVRVGVAYGSDIDTVHDLLTDVAMTNSKVVRDPPPAVFCVALADSSINFEMRVFVKSMLDIMPLSHELHAAITHTLRDAGIQIPFPQRDIHIKTDA